MKNIKTFFKSDWPFLLLCLLLGILMLITALAVKINNESFCVLFMFMLATATISIILVAVSGFIGVEIGNELKDRKSVV